MYLSGLGCISPQHSLDGGFLQGNVASFQSNRLSCIEPDYSQFVDAKAIRRMSRVIKMGTASAKTALTEAGIEMPEAVIVGTSLGCIEDTDSFLRKLVQNKEEMLNPTPFIHSTHNTIAGQIALQYQCRNYNSTYVHRTISFESALLDGFLMLNDSSAANALIGGIDELNDTSFKLFERLHSFKTDSSFNSKELYTSSTKGSIAGEGSAFFAFTGERMPTSYAKVLDVQTLFNAGSEEAIEQLNTMLKQHSLSSLSAVISGQNGDKESDTAYEEVLKGQNVFKYKHLCGEYATSASFATYLAAQSLKSGVLINELAGEHSKVAKPESILLYHRFKNLHHSFILLAAC